MTKNYVYCYMSSHKSTTLLVLFKYAGPNGGGGFDLIASQTVMPICQQLLKLQSD